MTYRWAVWEVKSDTFPFKTSKIYHWKRWDDHHKISFSNNRKTKLNIQPLSSCRFLQQTRSHTTRFNQSRVQIHRQRMHIRAIKDRQSTCLWQNQGGQIVSQAILDQKQLEKHPIRQRKRQIHTKAMFHKSLKFHWQSQKYNKIGVSCETLSKGWKMVQKYMFHVEQFGLAVVFHVKQKPFKNGQKHLKTAHFGHFLPDFPSQKSYEK